MALLLSYAAKINIFTFAKILVFLFFIGEEKIEFEEIMLMRKLKNKKIIIKVIIIEVK